MNDKFIFNKKTPKEIDRDIAGRIRSIRRGEISLISLTKIAVALELEGELERLFEDAPYLSIEEIMNEDN